MEYCERARTADTFAAPVPFVDVRFGVDEEFCNFGMTLLSSDEKGGAGVTAAAGVRKRGQACV